MARQAVPLIARALELDRQDRLAAMRARDLGGPGRFRAITRPALPLSNLSHAAEEPNRHD